MGLPPSGIKEFRISQVNWPTPVVLRPGIVAQLRFEVRDAIRRGAEAAHKGQTGLGHDHLGPERSKKLWTFRQRNSVSRTGA
jgi:hypothetical protein